ncbi:MAG: GNAT family N-acetyltransferase [Desulfobacterales bacterium]|nr:GNAT family N-acetyltransferase [Desulfobacterales bacterium]
MLKIETVSRDHNRSGFDCGNDALNQYLKKIARQHLNKGLSRTFVLVDDNIPTEILGFFTLVSCEIFVDKLPRKYAKKYPSKAPAAKLARLAVAKDRQRQGLGTHMMINAVERVIRVSQDLGIIGFFVDAKGNKAKAYYEQFGFIQLPDNPLELFLPLATLRNAYDTISKG